MTENNGLAPDHERPPSVRVGIAAIIREQPGSGIEVLAAWRSRAAIRGGVWEFPGGKIEAGEDAAATARRETREELGIEIEVIRNLDVAVDFDPSQSREQHVTVEMVLARSLSGDPSVRTRAWRWWPWHELQDLPWPKANATLVKTLCTVLADQTADTTTASDS